MFGYVKPVPDELLVREHEFYKCTYCGICRSMKRHTGFFSNVHLTYDSVFLALLRMVYIPECELCSKKCRCIAHPLKKKNMLADNSAIEYTARAFAILSYHKLRDDVSDERGFKRFSRRLLLPIFNRARRLAAMPELDRFVGDKLREISALERAGCESVDTPAALFGDILGRIFSEGLSEREALVARECGYHLGKFIYAADAAEDYERDRRSGSYNPYVKAYGGAPLTDENRSTIKCALLLESRRIEAALNLIPFGSRRTLEEILKNIIYLGLTKRIAFLDPKGESKDKKGVKN